MRERLFRASDMLMRIVYMLRICGMYADISADGSISIGDLVIGNHNGGNGRVTCYLRRHDHYHYLAEALTTADYQHSAVCQRIRHLWQSGDATVHLNARPDVLLGLTRAECAGIRVTRTPWLWCTV